VRHFARFSWVFVCVCVFVFVLLLGSPVSWGQAATGRIFGAVVDQQGASVPGATLTATNEATHVSNTATTNNDGYFEILDLSIGTYTVTVEHAGFTKYVTKANKLLINQSLKFEITLKVGTPTQTVTVESQATTVETESPTLGQSVTSRPLVNLPLNGRNVLDLALLQPGVTEADPDFSVPGMPSTTVLFSVAGGRPDSVTYLLDGGLNNNLLNNTVVLNPNPDTIAEFRILTSDYTAEYGRNNSGIVSVVTKSGTNQVHGSAFEFARNDFFNANTYFNKLEDLPRDDLKRNQYGGTLGGPITIPHVISGKDRFFFFLGYQGQRLSESQVESETSTFTPAEITGDFSAAGTDPFSGNPIPEPGVRCFLSGLPTIASDGMTVLDPCTDPNTGNPLPAHPYFQSNAGMAANAMIDPTKINAIAAEYIANGWIPTSPTGLISTPGSHTDNDNELTGKLDFLITAKDKLSATLGGSREPTLDPFDFATVGGFPDLGHNNNYLGNIAYTRTFSPTLVNELRFTAQRNNHLQANPGASLPTASALNINTHPDNPTGPPNLFFDTGLDVGFDEHGPTTEINNTYGLSDTVTWVKGRNTWKFGGGVSAYQNNTVYDFYVNGEFDFYGPGGNGTGYGTPSADPNFSFGSSFADFLLGAVNSYFQYPAAPSNIRSKSTYGFVQDEWRVRKNFTLSLGLRYEYNSPKLDTEGRTFSLFPGAQSTVFPNSPIGLLYPGDAGAPRGVNFPDKNDWGPRFGFAWDPWNNGKTSVRGGIGVFYDVLKGEDNLQFNGQPPFFSSAGLFFGTIPGNQAGDVQYFADPFGSLGVPDPFPSKPPNPNLDFGASGFLPINAAGGVYYVDPHLRTPYTYQYNLSVQHELAKNLVAEVSYVGSSSKKLTALEDVNPFVLGTYNRTLNLALQNNDVSAWCAANSDPSQCPFATAPTFANVGFANFNSLEASLTRQPFETRFFGTTYFTLAYTYGHGIDTSSGFRNRNSQVPFYNIQQFRASSDSDIRNRVTFSGGWDLPFDRAWQSGPKFLTKGWSLYPIVSWRTGFPLDVNAELADRFDPSAPGPSAAGDPYLVNSVFASGFSSVQYMNPKAAGNYFFNPAGFSDTQNAASTPCNAQVPNELPSDACAVATPALRTYGLPRNTLRGPGRTNFDLALAKSTRIFENLNAELRLEAFNILNHTEFSNPDTGIDDFTFGQETSTFDPRIVQIALRLTF